MAIRRWRSRWIAGSSARSAQSCSGGARTASASVAPGPRKSSHGKNRYQGCQAASQPSDHRRLPRQAEVADRDHATQRALVSGPDRRRCRVARRSPADGGSGFPPRIATRPEASDGLARTVRTAGLRRARWSGHAAAHRSRRRSPRSIPRRLPRCRLLDRCCPKHGPLVARRRRCSLPRNPTRLRPSHAARGSGGVALHAGVAHGASRAPIVMIATGHRAGQHGC